jgi:signal transduction histidine kinase
MRRIAEFTKARLPRRTVRLRLTLLYGSLFVVSGAALLGITYLLMLHASGEVVQVTSTQLAPPPGRTGPAVAPTLEPVQAQGKRLLAQADHQRTEQLHQLLVQSGIALAMMAVVSVGLGWLVAGRVLRPLRTMAVTTRRISERNLDQRLGLEGPEDELKDLGDTIDGLLSRLEAAFQAQRRFVANASHELRTPLSMMRTSLDVATGKPGPLPPQLTALEGKLREGLDRADRLLGDFLVLARAQQSALPDQASVSLSRVAATAVDRRGEAIRERGISLRQQLEAVEVTGSASLLAHMVDNLVDNAIRHNEPSGWILVETRTDDHLARLVVENGGPVLDQRVVEGLTEPFRRLGAARTVSEGGVGLGLSIVAAIVAAHHGRLELHARRQGGMRVVVELPRTSTSGRFPAPNHQPTGGRR